MESTNGLVTDAEIKSFFDSAPPLRDSAGITNKLKEFIQLNSAPQGMNNTRYLYCFVLSLLLSLLL